MRRSNLLMIIAGSLVLAGVAGIAVYPAWIDPASHLNFREDFALAREPSSGSAPGEAPRLLFITVDGVRPDEFVDCAFERDLEKSPCSFPKLWNEIRARRFEASAMRVGNSRNLSLPGYQTIFSGAAQDETCIDNATCPQIPVPTWLESIAQARYTPPAEVAVIGAWNKLTYAVEEKPGRIFVNSGLVEMYDPTDAEFAVPPELAQENQRQFDPEFRPEWQDARADRFTFRYARWYLTHVKPQVLVMSLLDSDEYGHLDQYGAYRKSLRTYDDYIDALIRDLKSAGMYDNTIIVVTTDHGRGAGFFGFAFQSHGPEWYLDHSKYAWIALSVPPRLQGRWKKLKQTYGTRAFTQRDIRPIIEGLMIPTE